MITPEDIKLQLMTELPKYTDEFSTIVTADSAEMQTLTAVQVTKTAHGLSIGDIILCSQATIALDVTAMSFDNTEKEMTITIDGEHDRTSDPDDLDNKGEYNQAVLEGFTDSNYDGSFTIKRATSNTVIFDADVDHDGSPFGQMIENRSLIVGFLTVTQIMSADSFIVNIEDEILASTEFETFKYTTVQNIFIAADVTRATTLYAQRRDPDPALFIVMGEERASKDRDTINDSVTFVTPQNPINLVYIQEVTLLAIAVTKKQHSAADKQEEIYDEVKGALRRAMFGHVFEETDNALSGAAIEISNTPLRLNTGYYVHTFVYQIPYRISIEQGDTFRRNVSFRDLIVNSTMFDNEGALVSLETEPEI